MRVFVSVTDAKIAAMINASTTRVVMAAPAIRARTAEALRAAINRLGKDSVAIVIDCNEEVYRLGYGEFDALLDLRQAGCEVRQCAGLRAGVLVCDNNGWVFAPTALYVEPEVHSDETPNAVVIRGPSVDAIVQGVLTTAEGTSSPIGPKESYRTPEIGFEGVTEQELMRTSTALELAPPVPFDIARQVRVFEPYIQYVEINLRGCAIQRCRLEVPKTIQGLDARNEMSNRLRTTFELIERNSEVSSQQLERELKTIRDHFTRSLGKPWGRVILRAVRPMFDDRVKAFRQRLEVHRQTIEVSIVEQLNASRQQLVNHFLPIALENPPDLLAGQMTTRPTAEEVKEWLNTELKRVFPEPRSVVSDMMLNVQFRDVTYETLKEQGFGEKLRAAYPRVDWEKPFQEFDAARAREDMPEA